MVYNYQGVMKGVEKATPQSLTVRDCMSKKLVTFHPDQSMEEVIQTLLKKRISGGPVIDKDDKLVGMISEGDCLKELVKGKYLNSPNHSGTVKDHMVTNVVTIDPNTEILEVAQKFLKMRLRRFPVMKEGKLIGQISQKDVMEAVLKLKNETWSGR